MKRTSKKRPGVGLLAFGEGCHVSLVLVVEERLRNAVSDELISCGCSKDRR